MTQLRRTLFISDLHLEQNRPEITEQFLRLLKQLNSSVDALYILGDLFESWIGDDDGIPEHKEIIHALNTATQNGTPIYFIYGNRDFLIGKKFLRETGCRLLPDETKINLYGNPVLIMHGDTLCTKDIAYIKLRSKIRNRFVQTIFLWLPLKIRKKIANKMRQKSMQHTAGADLDVMDVTQEEVVNVMQKHQTNTLIHGHTHRPGFHDFSVEKKPMTRIVLGAWHEGGSVLMWEESGNKKLLTLAL